MFGDWAYMWTKLTVIFTPPGMRRRLIVQAIR